jgi:hypothetical protein
VSQLRYEAVAITVVVGIAGISAMRYAELEKLTYRSIVLPLLFLPVAWQRLINLNNRDLQLPQGRDIFNLATLKENLVNAWAFFTSQPEHYNTIPVLFYLALIGIAYGVWQLIRHKERRTRRVMTLGGAAFISAFLLLVIILSFNNATGGLIHPATVRYGIIFLPFIVYGVILLLNSLAKFNINMKRYIWLGVFVCLAWYWPVAANNESLRHLTLYREYKVTLDFLKQNYTDSNIIVIAERPGLYTPHLWGAVDFPYANTHKNALLKKLENHLVQDIVTIQKIRYANHKPTDSTQLHGYTLNTLNETQTHSEWYLRFSKVLLP